MTPHRGEDRIDGLIWRNQNKEAIVRRIDNRLWPYGLGLALAAVPVIWLLASGMFYLSSALLKWPAPGNETALLYFSLAACAIPPVLLMLDFVAARGAKIGSKWLSVDFSKTISDGRLESRRSLALQDNILAEQERLQDSGGTKMLAAMRRATSSEIVYLDLKDGNAWWTTRLLALCAGAQQTDSLKAIVFVGQKENRERQFLGWGSPGDLLSAILNDNAEYAFRYRRAVTASRQLSLFYNAYGSAVPTLSPSLVIPPTTSPLQQMVIPATAFIPGPPGTLMASPVQIQLNDLVAAHQFSYDENEAVMLAKITLEEIQGMPSNLAVPLVDLETIPDRLTVSRLQALFAHCLHTETVDRAWSNDKQLSKFLASDAAYVALTHHGAYEGLLRSQLGVRAVIRELLRESRERVSGGAPDAGPE